MNTDYTRKNQQIASNFYNPGLEEVRIRDLSGAVQCLKKSLHFNEYQADVRNPLGLIYHENSEMADALVQRVISLDLQPEDSLVDHYLDEIQRKPEQLEIESQNVKTFNQALWHAQSGSGDLVILQLARVVEPDPHFVKTHLFPALLYMTREDSNKAGRYLYEILQIDKSNQKAPYYMSIVKQNTGRADAEKRKMVKAFSHRKMEDDDVTIPNTYKENTGISTVFHIIIGLVLGTMVFYFLILSARTRSLNSIHDNNPKSYMQKLNNVNQQYDILKTDYDELDAHTKEIQARLDELTTGNTSAIVQYQGLIWILQDYRSGDLVMAARAFVGAGFDLIEDENIQAIVENIYQGMAASIYQSLVDRGPQLWNAGNKTEAMDYFQASLTIKPDNPEALFYVGRLYQDADDTDNVNSMSDKVVSGFPDSEYVDRIKNARGYQFKRFLRKDTTEDKKHVFRGIFLCTLQALRKEYGGMEQTTFTYEVREQMPVIHLPGELDHYNRRNLKRDTDLLLAENYINRIVFDFTHTSFMGLSGIGVLLNHHKQMAASRGAVAHYGAGSQVRRILEMGGVSHPIKGYEDRESAVKG